MFAAALCPAHLDGNGRLDIIVGAPAFTGSTPNMSLYEVGAAHVFYGMDLSSTGAKVRAYLFLEKHYYLCYY